MFHLTNSTFSFHILANFRFFRQSVAFFKKIDWICVAPKLLEYKVKTYYSYIWSSFSSNTDEWYFSYMRKQPPPPFCRIQAYVRPFPNTLWVFFLRFYTTLSKKRVVNILTERGRVDSAAEARQLCLTHRYASHTSSLTRCCESNLGFCRSGIHFVVTVHWLRCYSLIFR